MDTILLVEDNKLIRELVREMLEMASYEVIEARDGNEAFLRLEEATPRLVVLDIQLPGVDGYAVLQRLRADARFNKLPVIALTAYAMDSDRQKGLEAGFDCYLTKPIERLWLLENIKALIEKPRQSISLKKTIKNPFTTPHMAPLNPSS